MAFQFSLEKKFQSLGTMLLFVFGMYFGDILNEIFNVCLFGNTSQRTDQSHFYAPGLDEFGQTVGYSFSVFNIYFFNICHAISHFFFVFSLFLFPFSLLSLFHIPCYILPCFQTSSFLDLSPYTLVLLVVFFFQILYDFLRPSVMFPFQLIFQLDQSLSSIACSCS